MKTIEVDPSILIFAFRYALNRNTTAPWLVSKEIKFHWNSLDSECKRQIKEDIERQRRLTKDETSWSNKVSEDWIDLLNWIESR